MSRRTIISWLILLSLLAFTLRLGAVIYLRAWQKPNAMEHRSVALSLVQGHGFSFGDWQYYGPSSVQSPPFPFLLASMFKIFGTDTPTDGSLTGANRAYFAIMVLNCIAGAGLVWLTYLMTRILGANDLAALLAAAAVAVWPSQVYAARHVQAIVLITCAMTASIILFYRAMRTGSRRAWIGYSIIATIATLTEPVLLPSLAISGLLTLIWPRLTGPTRVRNAAILFLAVAAIIGPWSVRNRIVHGKWVPIKSTFWVNMWKGNNQYSNGTDRMPMSSDKLKKIEKNVGIFKGDDDIVDSGAGLDRNRQYDMLALTDRAQLDFEPEAFREEVFKNFALTWIKNNPRAYLRLCGVRFMKTITVDWDNPKSYNLIYIVSRYLILGLTIAGLIVAWREKWSLLFPSILAGTALLTYTLTVTAARFSIPFEPLQLSIASGFLAWIVQKFRTSPTTSDNQPSLSAVAAYGQ